MERHTQTITQLSEMQKTLQVKLMNLITKRDNLLKQIDGNESEMDKENYDQLEREVTLIESKCDKLQQVVDGERRLKAEVINGVSMLTERLGLTESGSILTDIEKCRAKMQEVK